MGVTIHGVQSLPDRAYARRNATRFLTIHCAATSKEWDGTVDDVRVWHTEERGWKDVGYHYFIRRDGTIERGRPRWALGAHVEGHNHEALGICLAGGSDERGNEENNFTEAQWKALRELLAELKQLYPSARINGHRDFPGVTKYCPSFDVAAWLAENPL